MDSKESLLVPDRQKWATVGEPDDPRMVRFDEMVANYYRSAAP